MLRRLAWACVLCVTPLWAQAMPAPARPGISTTNPSTTLVQGWWEHEHWEDRARRSYWRLPPPAYERYNRLQAEIYELQQRRHEIDERIARAIAEQQRMLGFERR